MSIERYFEILCTPPSKRNLSKCHRLKIMVKSFGIPVFKFFFFS